jgi:putative flippase GtrA
MDIKVINTVIKQFIKFSLVGILNTVVSLIVYYVLIFLNINYLIANSIAFIVSVFNSYCLNRIFVFKSTGRFLETMIKTYTAYLITYVIGMINLYILVDVLKMSELIAPLIVIGVNVPINFILNRNWSMK